MKKRILALITSMLMLMTVTMAPTMVFAGNVQDGDVPPVNVSIGIGGNGDVGKCTIILTDDSEFDLIFDTWLENECARGSKLAEAMNIKSISEPTTPNGDSSAFLGWMISIPGVDEEGNPVDIIDEPLSTEELMEYIIPAVNPLNEDEPFNINVEGVWDEEAVLEGGSYGVPMFAVSSNGGKLEINDDLNEFYSSADCYYGIFHSPGPVGEAVAFKIADVENPGKVLSGWTVYEADAIEIDSIETFIADANGGLPPWGHPDLKHFIFDEYVSNGVEMTTFIGLWNNKMISTNMSTEELYSLGGNDKSYYAVANWTIGSVKELTVGGQEAKLEFADEDILVGGSIADKFANVEQVKNALTQAAFESNETFIKDITKFKYMEITLKVKNANGIWEAVTPEDFPKEGVEVVIPYPSGTDKDAFQFSVLHMLSHGNKAGTVETLVPRLEEDGLHVVVHSLSPFAVAYQEASAATYADSTPVAGDTAKTDGTPVTGDASDMTPWIIMATVAIAIGAWTIKRKVIH